jgi:hypothetical protein
MAAAKHDPTENPRLVWSIFRAQGAISISVRNFMICVAKIRIFVVWN